MRHAKNNNATAQTMAELSGMLGLIGATKFQINYKPNKVTASCRFNGKSYGANATNFDDVITDLLERVKLGSFFHNQI